MSSSQLEAMMDLSRARAEAYLHVAKSMVMNEFGPATEHTHTDIAIGLATAMLQHEGAQIVADAIRSTDG
jgi:hypothetical protein